MVFFLFAICRRAITIVLDSAALRRVGTMALWRRKRCRARVRVRVRVRAIEIYAHIMFESGGAAVWAILDGLRWFLSSWRIRSVDYSAEASDWSASLRVNTLLLPS